MRQAERLVQSQPILDFERKIVKRRPKGELDLLDRHVRIRPGRLGERGEDERTPVVMVGYAC